METTVCPDCGSADVRWRRRRFYDVILNYVRYMADTTAGTIFSSRSAYVPGSGVSDRTNEGRVAAIQYAEARKIYEDRVGSKTASRFWKCRHCGHRGQVFDDVAELLAGRGQLAEMEGTIADNLGTVVRPIQGNEPPPD